MNKNSILKRWGRGIIKNKKASFGIYFVSSLIGLSIFGPLFTLDPTAFLGTPLSPPSLEHFFGTNGQGQDVLSQTIAGARQTLHYILEEYEQLFIIIFLQKIKEEK